MKRPALFRIGVALLLLLLIVTAAWKNRTQAPPPQLPPPVAPKIVDAPEGSTLTTLTDPTLVFQKAFWRRPEPEDKILHAERREWTTAKDGVRQWQWFVEVRPGPRLRAWLRTNPFALAPTGTPKAGSDPVPPPEWFPKPSSTYKIQQSSTGFYTLMLSADETLVFACDSGFGFAPPVK